MMEPLALQAQEAEMVAVDTGREPHTMQYLMALAAAAEQMKMMAGQESLVL
jgi:hypothetical protein